MAGCLGWKHLLSFNDECGADFNLFRGTKLEATVAVGRLPYQFLYSWQQVLRDRVAAQNCILNMDTYETLFGLKAINLVRLLDSSDTKLNRTFFPPACPTSNFNFNWKKVKEGFQGLNMPPTCSAAKFAKDGVCDFRVQILPELNIEVSIRDTCTVEADTGFGLPQFSISCNGTLCDYVGKPCMRDSECGASLHCDALGGNVSSNAEWLGSLGMVNSTTCAESLWSGVLNAAAYFMGFTDKLETAVYSEFRMCGIEQLSYLIPSESTEKPSFTCQVQHNASTATFNLSALCDDPLDCSDGFDNNHSSLNCLCGEGQWFDSAIPGCCPLCPSLFSGCSRAHCGNNSTGISLPNCTWDDSTAQYHCGWLKPTSIDLAKLPPKQLLSYAVSDKPTEEHILFWSDCDGNLQFGNQNALGVLNARLPIHTILAELQRILENSARCRNNVDMDLARAFFPWGLKFWSSVFFDVPPTGEVSPGAQLDNSLRWYPWSQRHNQSCMDGCRLFKGGYQDYEACGCYEVKAPLANLQGNIPASCNASTMSTNNPSCAFNMDISEWFAQFPLMAGSALLKFRADTKCSSVFPALTASCEGDTNGTGCRILRWAFTPPADTCPKGYEPQTVAPPLTSVFFANNQGIEDTTLINTLNLIAAQDFHFQFPGFPPSPAVPFISAVGTANRTICLLAVDRINASLTNWSNRAFTDSNGVPRLNPVAPIPFGACEPENCQDFPRPRRCEVTGCPLSLQEFQTLTASSSSLPLASFFTIAALAVSL